MECITTPLRAYTSRLQGWCNYDRVSVTLWDPIRLAVLHPGGAGFPKPKNDVYLGRKTIGLELL